jgi:hypothetical protein
MKTQHRATTIGLVLINVARCYTTQTYCLCKQRAILNFTPGQQRGTSLLGVNLAPRGEICPLGGMLTPTFTSRGEHSLL